MSCKSDRRGVSALKSAGDGRGKEQYGTVRHEDAETRRDEARRVELRLEDTKGEERKQNEM